jgi:restriction endonuclease S subunit
MAVWSAVKASELKQAGRLDAEYFHPKYLANERRLAKAGPNCRSLASLLAGRVINGWDFRDFSEEGIPYVRVGDVVCGEIRYRDAERVDIPRALIRKDVSLNPGDILFTRKGTYGRSAVVEAESANCLISSEIMRLRVNAAAVLPRFLSSFLNSQAGYLQVERRTHGVSNFSISQRDLANITVIVPSKQKQQETEDLVKRAHVEQEKSCSMYLQAERAVLRELGWDRLDLSQPQVWTVRSARTTEALRIDPEHFQPKYDKLINYLKATKKAKQIVGIIREPVVKGVAPGYDPAGPIAVVNSQHLGRYCLDYEATDRTTEEHWKANKRAQIGTNDVMMYATGAHIGRTNVYLEAHRALAGIDVLLVRPTEDCNPLYLAVFLNAPVGLMQSMMFHSGSGQAHIYSGDVERYWVYLPPMSFQDEVADMVRQSYGAHQTAEALLKDVNAKVDALCGEEGERAKVKPGV